MVGSLTLAPFTAKVLVDNGAAQLSLTGMTPRLSAAGDAQDFMLSLLGSGFTANSLVQWEGADRPTTFISSYRLSAVIPAGDVDSLGNFAVRVRDLAPAPGGSVSGTLMFHVVPQVFAVYLPQIAR